MKKSEYDINDTFNDAPNFTILTPGVCNAKCDFCFWNHEDGKIKPTDDYLSRLELTLLNLPKQFKLISISGGEPTISKYFDEILTTVRKVRQYRSFDRVVLTTNGTKLLQKLSDKNSSKLFETIDFINISRHGIDDSENEASFKTSRIPDTEDLKLIISLLKEDKKIPVTLNCVIPEESNDIKWIMRYLSFAKNVKASSVSFRKVASNISPTKVEKEFMDMFGNGNSNNCPVCRGRSQDVLGFEVRWKGSVTEPSVDCKKVYEGVFHPDGHLYADWARNIPIDVSFKTESKSIQLKVINVKETTKSSNYASCGSSSGGCR